MNTALASPPVDTAPLPLELPRLVMVRALMVAPLAMLLALVLGFLRSGEDIRIETEGALELATTMMRIGEVAKLDDAEARRALHLLHIDGRLRHVNMTLTDAQGKSLLATLPQSPVPAPLAWMVSLHRHWQRDDTPLELHHTLARPNGQDWQLSLQTMSDTERLDGMRYLLEEMLADSMSLGVMLLVMSFSVRGVFKPMRSLLGAIGRIQRNEPRAAETLPIMAVGELREVVTALRQLHDARQVEEERRRVLSHQVQNLQEDERQRLARELHDEFGQRLTALRVDAAWLQQHLAGQAELQRVADGMAVQCARLHQDIRNTLARLQPLGPAHSNAPLGASHLAESLKSLVAGWDDAPGLGVHVKLQLQQVGEGGQVWPWPGAADDLPMPRELLLTLYRMSQEALTNVARHAQAQNAEVGLVLRRDGDRAQVDWSVCDDGVGLAKLELAQQRGNGLAGLKERAWSQGGDLQGHPARPGKPRPGLKLEARFHWTVSAVQGAGTMDEHEDETK
ncbi:signal transduction histidine kinase, glucose-6-phosphate specific [Burkholderiales bacterium JOSHI_001]|nr:signal transduction histidine kinase, glucose-6-phosphate specific [Burkholderiales bacterium JOSHI_001]